MRVGRILAALGLVAVVAACGSDGRSLEDWVAEADGICKDVGDEVDDLGIESTSDVLEHGEEAVALAEGAVEDLNDLEPPSADDDAELADVLIDQLDTLVQIQQTILEAAGDGRDEIGLLQAPLEFEEEIDEGADAADDVDSDDCLAALEERQDGLDQVRDAVEALGPMADVRVGACVTGLDDELAPAGCEDDDAEGQVVSTSLTDDDACAGDAQPESVAGAGYCIDAFGPPPEADGVLEVGSCIALTRAAAGTVNISELDCGDPAVTHEVTSDVRPAGACPRRTRRFAKSDDEVALSGPGDWCAERL